MIAYFDSGTTNSRIYMLKNGKIIYSEKQNVGSKDSALSGNSAVLLNALKDLYDQALSALSATDADVEAIYLSGMVSCPSGIHEVEHLPVPAGSKEIRDNITVFNESTVFHRSLSIIPGLKTIPQGIRVPPEVAVEVNNVRGEEIEILGIQSRYVKELPEQYLLVMPGSHTQIAIMRYGKIVDLISCVTGELFAVINSGTIIGSSIAGGKMLVPDMVRLGCHTMEKYGFNRALYTVRSLELFGSTTPHDRKSMLEGILNAGVAQAVYAKLGEDRSIRQVAVYGTDYQAEVLRTVFRELYPDCYQVDRVKPDSVPMSVYGILSILESR